MTILIYTGTPGSGKSCHAAREIRMNLNSLSPRPVIANFELAQDAPVRNRAMFHYVPNSALRVEDLQRFAIDYWESHGGKLIEDYISIYLDEAQILWNARNWSQKDRLGWLEFLSQSRKYGYRVVFISQSAQMIDNQFRMLIEIEVNHRRVSQFGVVGWLMALPFRGRLMMAVKSMFQIKERIGSEWFLSSKRDWQMYDSYKRFDPTKSDDALRLVYSAEEYENAS